MKKALSFLLTAAMIMSLLVFPVSAEETATHEAHCYCVNAEAIPEGHVCEENPTWEPFVKGAALKDGGHYYLTENYTGTQLELNASTEVYLCLNGHSLSSGGKIIKTFAGSAVLHLCDCGTTGQMLTNSGSSNGAFATVAGTMNLYSGSIVGGKPITVSGGQNGGLIVMASSTSTINMYGGTITGGSITSTKADDTVTKAADGGNINVSAGTFTMYGGEISNGSSLGNGNKTGNGGNVTVSSANGTFIMKGGRITGGNSAKFGGNVGIYGGSFIMEGGTIDLGESTTYGGNIGILSGTLEIKGGTIKDGTAGATSHGGNIGMGGGSMTMTDGSIENGTAGTAAGMSMQNGATASVTGGEFVDCGIYFNTNGNLTLGGDAVLEIYYTGDKTGVLQLDETNTFTGLCGITMKTPGQFLATETDHCANFVSHVSGYGVAFTGSAMTLKAYTAKAGSNSYILLQDAINNAEGSYVKLLTDVTEDVTVDGTVYLDLNGKVLTGNIDGTGTLCGMDNSGDTYVAPTGRIEGTVSCQVADHIKTSVTGSVRRYAAIADDTGYTFHRYYMGITHMSLKPGVTGVGYKAVFHADEQVQALLAKEGSFGYILQLDGFDAQTCALDLDEFVSGEPVTLRLHNIDVKNYGTTAIKGKVFMNFGGTVIESSEYSYTMKTMVETAANYVAEFTVEQMTALQKMCNDNSEAMKDWNIDSIRNWTEPTE